MTELDVCIKNLRALAATTAMPATLLMAANKLEQMRDVQQQLRGGVADLRRHIRAYSAYDPPRFIPASICAIVGAMSRVIVQGK